MAILMAGNTIIFGGLGRFLRGKKVNGLGFKGQGVRHKVKGERMKDRLSAFGVGRRGSALGLRFSAPGVRKEIGLRTRLRIQLRRGRLNEEG
jgi:hypothetical protein